MPGYIKSNPLTWEVRFPRWAIVFFVCSFVFFQSSSQSGFIPSTVALLEPTFNLTSRQSGAISSAYDISTMFFITHVGHLCASRAPRFMGLGMGVMGLSLLLFAFTNLVPQNTPKTSSTAYSLLLLSQVVFGFGASPLYVIAPTYFASNFSKQGLSASLGVFFVVGAIGPGVGYLAGGAVVESWIWWAGLVIIGLLAILFAIPLYLCPIDFHRPGEQALGEEENHSRISLSPPPPAHDGQQTLDALEQEGDEALGEGGRSPVDRARIKSYAAKRGSQSAVPLRISDSASPSSVILEEEDGDAPSAASLAAGSPSSASLQAAVAAKPRPPPPSTAPLDPSAPTAPSGLRTSRSSRSLHTLRRNPLVRWFLKVMDLLLGPALWKSLRVCFSEPTFVCNTLAATTQTLLGASMNFFFPSFLSKAFGFSPGMAAIYMGAAVIAGCAGGIALGSYVAKRINADMEQHIRISYISAALAVPFSGIFFASNGFLFLGLLVIFMALVFMSTVPAYTITMRSVPPEHRGVAVGVQSVVYRLCGAIPGPIILGELIDLSCTSWAGSCVQYDIPSLKRYWFIFAIIFTGLTAVFFFSQEFTWRQRKSRTSPSSLSLELKQGQHGGREKEQEQEQEKEKENGEQVDVRGEQPREPLSSEEKEIQLTLELKIKSLVTEIDSPRNSISGPDAV